MPRLRPSKKGRTQAGAALSISFGGMSARTNGSGQGGSLPRAAVTGAPPQPYQHTSPIPYL